MSPAIKTFVFFDLETTGLPQDLPKVTELCLVAVHRASLECPPRDSSGALQLPRILDKLCLFIDPEKEITAKATEITRLSNGNLQQCQKQSFDPRVVTLIKDFLQRQAQPVCLVAHNGNCYDFPLLKTELQAHGDDLSGAVFCLDSKVVLRGLDKLPGKEPSGQKRAYSLASLYKRFFKEDPKDSHFAEGDVLTLLMVFLFKAEDFLEWARTKSCKWEDVQPMYGSRLQQAV